MPTQRDFLTARGLAEQRDPLFLAQVAHRGERIAARRPRNCPRRRRRHGARRFRGRLCRHGSIRGDRRCRFDRRRWNRRRLEQVGGIFLRTRHGLGRKNSAPAARLRSAAPRSILARFQSLRAPALRRKNLRSKNNRRKMPGSKPLRSATRRSMPVAAARCRCPESRFPSLSAAPRPRATKHCRSARSRLPALARPPRFPAPAPAPLRQARLAHRQASATTPRVPRRLARKSRRRLSPARKTRRRRRHRHFLRQAGRTATGARERHHRTHAARKRAQQLGRFADARCRRFRAHGGFGNFANGGIEPVAQRRFDRALVQHEGDVQKALDRGGDVGRRRRAGGERGFDTIDGRGDLHEIAGGVGVRRTFAAQRRLDARDGTHDRGRVGVTIAIGVFGQEAAAAVRRHERGVDGIVVCLVRQPGQYQRQWVVGHGSTKRGRLNSTTANGAIRRSAELPTGSATAPAAQSIC